MCDVSLVHVPFMSKHSFTLLLQTVFILEIMQPSVRDLSSELESLHCLLS